MEPVIESDCVVAVSVAGNCRFLPVVFNARLTADDVHECDAIANVHSATPPSSSFANVSKVIDTY